MCHPLPLSVLLFCLLTVCVMVWFFLCCLHSHSMVFQAASFLMQSEEHTYFKSEQMFNSFLTGT